MRFLLYLIYLTIGFYLISDVTASDTLERLAGLSGLWFDPSQEGEGFNVLITGDNLIVTYFGYANDRQRWLISDALPLQQLVIGELSEPVELLIAEAGTFAMPVSSTQLTSWGTLKLQFDSCNAGVFELEGMDGSKRSQVTKLSGVDTLDCSLPVQQCGPDNITNTAFETVDGEVADSQRDRELAFRLYYPVVYTGCTPIVLISHGGNGNFSGHTRLTHLGAELASHGYMALHINHRPSVARNGLTANQVHLFDRPADVSFMLDALLNGQITLPSRFTGELAADRVGHIGHSFGAYTSHAVGGALTEQGLFTDPRIRAIVPLSPQGEGVFGFFGHLQADNSWRYVNLPSLMMVGELEIDSRDISGFIADGWRLQPFQNYPNTGDKWQIILADQGHSDIGGQGSSEVQAFIASNSRRFFDAYLRDIDTAACDVGKLNRLPELQISTLVDPLGALVACE